MKSQITTHVLDTAQGQPAENIQVILEIKRTEESWETLCEGRTDANGRINNLLTNNDPISLGIYRLTFDVAPYFQSHGVDSFYSSIPIVFTISNTDKHTHVPLLLSPFGYSTYRGS
ncbi:MAG: hydroxyisourate hydrolase [Candidatus Marinimicrobia bacterium]|nr:hydroxyisourate hydrolase [Candidatus Neomarinimicrobiota bacterium]